MVKSCGVSVFKHEKWYLNKLISELGLGTKCCKTKRQFHYLKGGNERRRWVVWCACLLSSSELLIYEHITHSPSVKKQKSQMVKYVFWMLVTLFSLRVTKRTYSYVRIATSVSVCWQCECRTSCPGKQLTFVWNVGAWLFVDWQSTSFWKLTFQL